MRATDGCDPDPPRQENPPRRQRLHRRVQGGRSREPADTGRRARGRDPDGGRGPIRHASDVSVPHGPPRTRGPLERGRARPARRPRRGGGSPPPVSYTHLTLPTIYSV